MFCTKCGKELQEGWKRCPFCGQEVSDHTVEIDEMISDGGNRYNNQPEDGEGAAHNEVKRYRFEGVRRTARFSFRRIPSDVEVTGNRVHVTTKGKKTVESEFSKQDVKDISLPLLPVLGMADKIRIVLFALLMFCSYGLSAFALLFFIKITLIRHIKIELNDGRVIKIPIRQKADAAEFLRELSYPEEKIGEIEKKAVSERKLSIREWVVSTVMLFIAAVTLVVGMEMYLENSNDKSVAITEESKEDSEDQENSDTEQLPPGNEDVKEENYKGDNLGEYLANSSDKLPIRVENVILTEDYMYTDISANLVNTTSTDIKEAIFGIVAWDSNYLPLKLTSLSTFDEVYLYKIKYENLAANQTEKGVVEFENDDIKAIQIVLLEYEDFEGDVWENPAAEYFEEQYAGKKFVENEMNAFIFD